MGLTEMYSSAVTAVGASHLAVNKDGGDDGKAALTRRAMEGENDHDYY
jgi:hypothetical protein